MLLPTGRGFGHRGRAGRVVFRVDGKVLTLRDRLAVRDAAGREVAAVRKHFFAPFRDRFTIDLPGPDDLEIAGDLLDHEFSIRRGDAVVATVSKRWFTLRDTYGVDVAEGKEDLLILASELALDLAEDEEGEGRREDERR